MAFSTAWFSIGLWALCLVALFFRFGLLSAVVGMAILNAFLAIPISADFGEWYAQPSTTILAIVLVIAGYGFYISTIRQDLTTNHRAPV
jgi:hypothetical protein